MSRGGVSGGDTHQGRRSRASVRADSGWRAPHALRDVRCRVVSAADRVSESGQPARRASRQPRQGVRGAPGARRVAWTPGAASNRRGRANHRVWRSPGCRRRNGRRRSVRTARAIDVAARRGHRDQSSRLAVFCRDVGGHRTDRSAPAGASGGAVGLDRSDSRRESIVFGWASPIARA